MDFSESDFSSLLKELTDIGVALSSQKDHDLLLELILEKAMNLTNADGGTLYTLHEGQFLKFAIMRTRSLGIREGGSQGEIKTLGPIALYDDTGHPNDRTVASWSALHRKTVNIDDVYSNRSFDFSGTRQFDRQTGYKSQSFLTVPLTDHENDLIGVLQLLNALDENGDITAFSELDQQVVESLASQAAVTITNRSLIDGHKQLFEAMIELIANAIDEKSPYTGGHCRRVPELTNMLAQAVCDIGIGPLKDFNMDAKEKYALNIAGWLHDCGKITTPEYVVDKATKLETIFDRISIVDTRFEVLKRDREIAALKKQLEAKSLSPDNKIDAALKKELEELNQEREFVRQCNIGQEAMSDQDQNKIHEIAKRQWVDTQGNNSKLLNEDELKNLTIVKGTLTPEERQIINNHMVITMNMLNALPYPKHLAQVPEYACGHHEKMDGSGYPLGLTREQMSVPARIMAIADIFEALTAADRPYKKAMPLSRALHILGNMKLNDHIDPDLFDVFIHQKVYLQYAEKFLKAEQIDSIDLGNIPGYQHPDS